MRELSAYDGYQAYFGDIHNHCNISYGHGSIEDAYANARLQLDFASVTGHAWWHDMPPPAGRLKRLVEYHQRGFDHLDSVWQHVQAVTEGVHEDGRFVSFLSFEWHSSAHGDHCVYYNGPRGEIIREPGIARMRDALRALAARGVETMMIPHHICYLDGYRGINWADFDPEFSPVVEIVSMHGCGEHDDAPRPYLHSMGPRDGRSSLLAGLGQGHRFGVIGSSDHHAAHPGSHGHGRMSVWAQALGRDALWEAIGQRRTCALTGDRIELAFELNGAAMGREIAATDEREIGVSVSGEAPLDYVEVVRNGQVVHRFSGDPAAPRDPAFEGIVALNLGWGEGHDRAAWDVRFGVEGGRILRTLPRFKGDVTVSPRDRDRESYHVSRWEPVDETAIALRSVSAPNPNVSTDVTQGFALEIEGDEGTRVWARINGRAVSHRLTDLLDGPRADYLDGFVSPAYQFSRAVPAHEYRWSTRFVDRRDASDRDWYYVRARQKNDQWAWSSPIFVG